MIVRAHDVEETVDVVRFAHAVKQSGDSDRII
jgi:dihydropteroate synthase